MSRCFKLALQEVNVFFACVSFKGLAMTEVREHPFKRGTANNKNLTVSKPFPTQNKIARFCFKSCSLQKERIK